MIRPRPHVDALAPVYHGSISDAELASLGLRRDQVIDFSTNTNPLGPSPAALAAARDAAWTHYPDDGSARLKSAIAERERVDVSQVVVGNGSAELIWLVALAFLGPGDRAVVVGPTFGEYARATRIAGAAVAERSARPEDDFAPPLDDIESARVLWLCDPNNPTGHLIGPPRLAELAEGLPETLVVVDEAYAPFVDDWPSWPRLPPNVVRLRSLTKDGAMPGLRLGYAVASREIAAALDAVRPPWSVNAVAQAAGLAALADYAHMERARAEVRAARTFVTDELTRQGWRVHPSAANFLLVEVSEWMASGGPRGAAPLAGSGAEPRNAPASASSAMPTGRSGECKPSHGASVRAALLRHGVVVRDCTSFGLPGHVRIGLRPIEECRRLTSAFDRLR